MKALVILLMSIFSVSAYASEVSYYQCFSNSPEVRSVVVKQVISANEDTISSTFNVEITDEEDIRTLYWQDGDIDMTSENIFQGPFKSSSNALYVDIQTPSFPDYQRTVSTVRLGSEIYQLDCNSL